jgi:hypothetical protein
MTMNVATVERLKMAVLCSLVRYVVVKRDNGYLLFHPFT